MAFRNDRGGTGFDPNSSPVFKAAVARGYRACARARTRPKSALGSEDQGIPVAVSDTEFADAPRLAFRPRKDLYTLPGVAIAKGIEARIDEQV